MYKSKKYSYEYEQIDEEEKSCETIVGDILADPEFANLEEVVIGFIQKKDIQELQEKKRIRKTAY